MKILNIDISKMYNELVFTDEELKKRLPKHVFEHFKKSLKDHQKEIINLDLANQIANAMKD
jgi:glutamine synthetase type III